MKEQNYPHHWKPSVEISIRKDISLNPGDRHAWFILLGKPGDKDFKEFSSRKVFANIPELGKDLIKFLKLFIAEYGASASVFSYRFKVSEVAKIVGVIGEKDIKVIKNEIVGLIHCNLESDI